MEYLDLPKMRSKVMRLLQDVQTLSEYSQQLRDFDPAVLDSIEQESERIRALVARLEQLED